MNTKRDIILCLSIICAFGFSYYLRVSKQKTGHSTHFKVDLSEHKNIVPVAIIGSGPAGLSAALYIARGNVYSVVFQGATPGGQLTKTSYIENWPGVKKIMGTDVIKILQSQAEEFGAHITPEVIKEVNLASWPYKLKTEDGKEITALSIIVSTGASPKKLGVQGEEQYWGKGVTTCAICDAPYHKDDDVVVVGGGDSAVEEALQLSGYAKSITLLVRSDKMRAAPAMIEKLKAYPHIIIKYNSKISKILGGSNGHVNAVELENTVDNSKSELKVGGVFLAIGHEPNTAIFNGQIKSDSNGYILVKSPTQETNIEGVFAAGDVSDNRYRQAGVAAGDGIKAALDALAFLRDIEVIEKQGSIIVKNIYEPEDGIEPLKINKITSQQEFNDQVLASPLPVIVDFYAPYCPSCMQMLPVVESVAAKFKDKVNFVKIDTSITAQLAKDLGVTKVPYILVFKDGQLIKKHTEVMTKHQLIEFVNDILK